MLNQNHTLNPDPWLQEESCGTQGLQECCLLHDHEPPDPCIAGMMALKGFSTHYSKIWKFAMLNMLS